MTDKQERTGTGAKATRAEPPGPLGRDAREEPLRDELTVLAEDVVLATTKFLVTGVGPMYPAIDKLAAHLGMREPTSLPREWGR